MSNNSLYSSKLVVLESVCKFIHSIVNVADLFPGGILYRFALLFLYTLIMASVISSEETLNIHIRCISSKYAVAALVGVHGMATIPVYTYINKKWI